MTIKITGIILLTVLFQSCGPQLSSLHWLEGNWCMDHPRGGERREVWEGIKGDKLSGHGLRIVERDTTLLEKLEIRKAKGGLYYIATVPDQNEGKPVPFQLVHATKTDFLFENRDHDFPKRILYAYKPAPARSEPDSLFVRVSDLQDKGAMFFFTRVK